MKIKICGITRLEDAQFACSLGIDALGFNFFNGSKRYIEPEKAVSIIEKMPPFITCVGLFVNESAEMINEISAKCDIDMIQIHGDETLEDSEKIQRPFLKAIRVKSKPELTLALEKWLLSRARGILLDSYHDSYYGGTGNTFNWSLIPTNIEKPIIVAGGLNDENIASVIKHPNIYGVDVSSGVEIKPGVKSHTKMASFVSKVHENGQLYRQTS